MVRRPAFILDIARFVVPGPETAFSVLSTQNPWEGELNYFAAVPEKVDELMRNVWPSHHFAPCMACFEPKAQGRALKKLSEAP